MENLPFDAQVFDFVISAGSLSYGEPTQVLKEICRVLRPGGSFICVDSFGHNPVYRLNRWIHFLRGNRSKSTLRNMPTLKTIAMYEQVFDVVSARFFGSISWLAPALNWMLGAQTASEISDWIDARFGVKRSAFKFVMVASGKK